MNMKQPTQTRWYEELREAHRPERVRVLLIGESAPDPGDSEWRFFYAPILDRRDNLFRGVVLAMFDSSPGHAGDEKSPWLARLKENGVYLIDLVPTPVDKLTGADQTRARREHVDACVAQARSLAPAGIIVCHTPSFDVLAEPLQRAGLPLLHERSIPFPTGNHRAKFVSGFKAAIAGLAKTQPSASAGKADRGRAITARRAVGRGRAPAPPRR